MKTYYSHDELQYRWVRPKEYFRELAQFVYDEYTSRFNGLYGSEREQFVAEIRRDIIRKYDVRDYSTLDEIIVYSIDHCY